MTGLVKSLLSLVGLAVVAYVVLFVPLGRYTLYQHATRIAGTNEAQELGDEAAQAAERLREHVEGELDEHVRDAGPRDAGIDAGPAR